MNMKAKPVIIIIAFFLTLVMAVSTLAAEGVPRVISDPPIDRSAYPSPDVPESAYVDDSYFNDAVFVGDSILSGLELYGLVPNATFACEIGTSAARAVRDNAFKHDDKYYTLIDYAMLSRPSKVYIMLGTNGVDIVKPDQVLVDMRKLIAYIVETWPHIIVYIISLPPVTPVATERYSRLTNANIRIYNEGLRQIALDYLAFYLHTYPLFTQEDGSLKRSLAAQDGYHMRKQAHEIFRDYLYTHTVALNQSVSE